MQSELSRLIGAEHVLEAGSGSPYNHDASRRRGLEGRADAVVLPGSAAEVAAVVGWCYSHDVPVVPRGGGTGLTGGAVATEGGVVCSLERLRAVRELEPALWRVHPEAGVSTRHVQRLARENGLFFGPDPGAAEQSQIGGNVATNAGGPRCLKYGVTRNYVAGLEVVLASGEVLRTGGRVHKNKTGFDLIGLFVGSEGMLGVVTEVTLKLLPMPPARATLSASFASMREAAATVQKIFAAGFLPSAVELADAFTLEAARRDSGAADVPDGNAHLLVELDGQPETVQVEMEKLRAIVGVCSPASLQVATTEPECERFWALRRAFSNSLRATGLTKLNQDIVVPRSRLVDLVEFAEALSKRSGFPIACFGHAGDGNIHVNIMADRYNREAAVRERAERALDELFAQVLAFGGVITGEHGIGLAKKRWWPQAASDVSREVHRAIKDALDPAGILNPGKFL